MEDQGLKQRRPPASAPSAVPTKQELEEQPHPSGEIKHGVLRQTLSMFLFGLYFFRKQSNACVHPSLPVVSSRLLTLRF